MEGVFYEQVPGTVNVELSLQLLSPSFEAMLMEPVESRTRG